MFEVPIITIYTGHHNKSTNKLIIITTTTHKTDGILILQVPKTYLPILIKANRLHFKIPRGQMHWTAQNQKEL
jgi:hypothetical protein